MIFQNCINIETIKEINVPCEKNDFAKKKKKLQTIYFASKIFFEKRLCDNKGV
jgi:hypothetical protein